MCPWGTACTQRLPGCQQTSQQDRCDKYSTQSPPPLKKSCLSRTAHTGVYQYSQQCPNMCRRRKADTRLRQHMAAPGVPGRSGGLPSRTHLQICKDRDVHAVATLSRRWSVQLLCSNSRRRKQKGRCWRLQSRLQEEDKRYCGAGKDSWRLSVPIVVAMVVRRHCCMSSQRHRTQQHSFRHCGQAAIARSPGQTAPLASLIPQHDHQ